MLKNTREPLALRSLSEAKMINILHLISVVGVIGAGILFVRIGILGVQEDERIKEILSSPSVKERFIKTYAKNAENQASHLLQEAEVFAQYLDAQEKTKKTVAVEKTENVPPQKPLTSPKFKVVATCYFEANPEMSQVLIDDPGKGRYWIQQSNTVDCFLIEQVKDGLVIVKSGEKTFELPLEVRAETGLPSKGSFASKGPIDRRAARTSRI